jgi:hypothetical protein
MAFLSIQTGLWRLTDSALVVFVHRSYPGSALANYWAREKIMSMVEHGYYQSANMEKWQLRHRKNRRKFEAAQYFKVQLRRWEQLRSFDSTVNAKERTQQWRVDWNFLDATNAVGTKVGLCIIDCSILCSIGQKHSFA